MTNMAEGRRPEAEAGVHQRQLSWREGLFGSRAAEQQLYTGRSMLCGRGCTRGGYTPVQYPRTDVLGTYDLGLGLLSSASVILWTSPRLRLDSVHNMLYIGHRLTEAGVPNN